jgi:glutaminyl-peptide cyclotransferase
LVWKSTILLVAMLALSAHAKEFSGARALEFTRRVVSFGPRPPGSGAIRKLQAYVLSELKLRKCEIIQDDFVTQTPVGAVHMKNIIARFPGSSRRAVVFSGHYDTKSMPGEQFVGANDGGSSAGLLLEMAEALRGAPRKPDVYLVWFDGEEAFGQWSATDSLYGSRHLAERWASDGTLSRIKALINVDMIGDRDLGILQESNSSASLRKLVWDTAAILGFSVHFLNQSSAIEDDHLPFVRKGVNAIDLIDYDYAPWHTAQDTMNKVSAESLRVVGTVLLEVLKELEQVP